MRRVTGGGAAALAVLLLAGCVQRFDTTTLGVPVTMAGPAGEGAAEGTRFKTSAHSVHGFFGLVTISQPSLQKALARQLVGGQQITQVRITTRSRWSDLLITGLTLGLIAPRTVTYEGVVIGR